MKSIESTGSVTLQELHNLILVPSVTDSFLFNDFYDVIKLDDSYLTQTNLFFFAYKFYDTTNGKITIMGATFDASYPSSGEAQQISPEYSRILSLSLHPLVNSTGFLLLYVAETSPEIFSIIVQIYYDSHLSSNLLIGIYSYTKNTFTGNTFQEGNIKVLGKSDGMFLIFYKTDTQDVKCQIIDPNSESSVLGLTIDLNTTIWTGSLNFTYLVGFAEQENSMYFMISLYDQGSPVLFLIVNFFLSDTPPYCLPTDIIQAPFLSTATLLLSIPLFQQQKDLILLIEGSVLGAYYMRKSPIIWCDSYDNTTLDCLTCDGASMRNSRTGKKCGETILKCEGYSDYNGNCDQCSTNPLYILSESKKLCASFIPNCTLYDDYDGTCKICSNDFPPLSSSDYFDSESQYQCTSLVTLNFISMQLGNYVQSGNSGSFDLIFLNDGFYFLYGMDWDFPNYNFYDQSLYVQILQSNTSSNVSLLTEKIGQKMSFFYDSLPAFMIYFKKMDRNNSFSVTMIIQTIPPDTNSTSNLTSLQMQIDPKTFNITMQAIPIKTFNQDVFVLNWEYNIQQYAMPNGDCLLIRVDNQTGVVIVVFEIYNNNYTKQKGTYYPPNYSIFDQLAGAYLDDELFLISKIINVTDKSTKKNYATVFLDFYDINLSDSVITLRSSQQVFTYTDDLNASNCALGFSWLYLSKILSSKTEKFFYLFWQQLMIVKNFYQKFNFDGVSLSSISQIDATEVKINLQDVSGDVALLADGRFVWVWVTNITYVLITPTIKFFISGESGSHILDQSGSFPHVAADEKLNSDNASAFVISFQKGSQLVSRYLRSLHIPNCQNYDDTLRACLNCFPNYILNSSNYCAPVIPNCLVQTGNFSEICEKCSSGFSLEDNQCNKSDTAALILKIVLPITFGLIMLVVAYFYYRKWKLQKIKDRADFKLLHIAEDENTINNCIRFSTKTFKTTNKKDSRITSTT